MFGFAGHGRQEPGDLPSSSVRDWGGARPGRELRAKAVVARAAPVLAAIREGMIFVFPPPPRSPSWASPPVFFDLMLQDRGSLGHDQADRPRATSSSAWQRRTRRLARVRPNAACSKPSARSGGRPPTGRRRARWACRSASRAALPVGRPSARPTSATSSTAAGSSASTPRPTPALPDATGRPRPASRAQPARRAGAALGPRLRTLGLRLAAPRALQRRAGGQHQASPGPGHSTGEAMLAMETPGSRAGDRPPVDGTVLPGADVLVAGADALRLLGPGDLPLLAALYESWTVPIPIVLALPLGVLGGVIASSARGLPTTSTSRSAC